MNLPAILGTETVVEDILSLLDKETNCAIQITGDEGRGKSWIADKIEEELSLKKYACIHLFGDETMMGEPYYPFKKFIEKKDKRYNKGLTAFKESIGEIPYLGKGIKVLVEDYAFRKEKLRKTIDEIEPFRRHMPFSLHLTGLLKKYRNIVIIADDMNLFDDETVQFLSSLNTGLVDVGLSMNISIICLTTKEHPISLGVNKRFHFSLPTLTKAQAQQALICWSEKKVGDEDAGTIFSCTGGHLQLIKIAAHYIKETLSPEITKNFKELLVWIIESRLKAVKFQYEKLKKLIVSINQAGKSTSSSELICLFDNDRETVSLIQQGVQMDILKIRDGYIHFTHTVVEDYVASLKDKHSAEFYNKLSDCIRKLNPSDYGRRAALEELAGRADLADVYWSLLAIQRFQQGATEAGLTISARISASETGNEIRDAIKQFAECYNHSIPGRIDAAILEAESIPNTLPKLVLAERYYVKCLNLAKRISNTAKEEALSIIEDWEDLKEEEPELWYRFSQIKIIAAAELGKLDLALKTEAAIIKYYSPRLTIDVQARKVLERLNLFSEVLYSPEVAHKKMLHSEDQLTKSLSEREQYERVIDLYIARTNLSSNSFLIEDFEKALAYSAKAISVLNEFPEVKFPYPEAAQNNLYLSLLFSDASQLKYVSEKYTELAASVTDQENKILITINLAGLQLLNNEPLLALKTLQGGDYIPVIEEDDWYYCYYYWINYAMVSFITGDHQAAKEAIESLRGAAGNVSHFLEKYYTMHYQVVKEIIQSAKLMPYSQVLEYIGQKKPIYSSKLWNRFKMGYLFTDLQVWTSS